MQLYNVRGGSTEELYAHKYNIGVGVSLGNKWFTPENIIELVAWSLEYTREYAVVYVADSIHAINIEVRNRRSPASALTKALRLGEEVLQRVQQLSQTRFSVAEQSRIHYARWSDLGTPEFKKQLNFLYHACVL